MAITNQHNIKRHYLKILSEYYSAVVVGDKKMELRLNDRKYKVGDHLILMEMNDSFKGYPTPNRILFYTGRFAEVEVTHIFGEPLFGLADGFIIMSIQIKHTTQQHVFKKVKSIINESNHKY